ncbi:hypothetical protein DMC47_08825 [Nostoc sp. 3335mG]|nr:hypothetical protein DMC47_08825 [Nostoc sp. 3335mG]
MRFDFLATPLDGDSPTGLDFEEEGDTAYFNYVLPAQGRLPHSYFDKDGNPFERQKINVAEESRAIAGFLARSYDLRLLLLEARIQAINGTFAGLADSLEGMALLLESFWEEAHPRADDPELRTIVLGGLDGQAQFVVPLHYMTIVTGNRYVQVTFRRYLVAAGEAPARENEEQVSLAQIADALRAKENAEALLACHANVTRALKAIERLDAVFRERVGRGLKLVTLPGVLQRIAALIAEYVEGLSPPAPTAITAGVTEEAGTGAPAAGVFDTAPVHDVDSPIQTRADASHALACAEAYYMACEPSSLALVLLHQARLLEGRPLVEAIETLLPGRAASTQVKLGPDGLFQLDMERLKQVTEDVVTGLSAGGEREAPNPAISASTRSEAVRLMALTEAYYRAMEPASPIPLLLNRAQSSANRDFMTILREILPPDASTQ